MLGLVLILVKVEVIVKEYEGKSVKSKEYLLTRLKKVVSHQQKRTRV